ncbi:MAG: hypothetical protein AAGI17_01600 [Planctomycetota bacterium]
MLVRKGDRSRVAASGLAGVMVTSLCLHLLGLLSLAPQTLSWSLSFVYQAGLLFCWRRTILLVLDRRVSLKKRNLKAFEFLVVGGGQQLFAVFFLVALIPFLIL